MQTNVQAQDTATPPLTLFGHLDRLKVAVTVSDLARDGCPLIYANLRFSRISRKPRERFLGNSLLALYSGDAQATLRDGRGIAISTGEMEAPINLTTGLGLATGHDELVFHRPVCVPGFNDWIASCHFLVPADKKEARSPFYLRNVSLRAINTFRLVDSAAMLERVRARTAHYVTPTGKSLHKLLQAAA